MIYILLNSCILIVWPSIFSILLFCQRSLKSFDVFIVQVLCLLRLLCIFLNSIISQRPKSYFYYFHNISYSFFKSLVCLVFLGSMTFYYHFWRLAAAWLSDENPTSPSSLLDWLLLSAMLSVCISHSLSSGMLPGLVIMVRTMEKARRRAKMLKIKVCRRALC